MPNQYDTDRQKQVVAFMLWFKFGYPATFIAKHLGYKSHASVIYIIKTLPSYLWRDEEYINELKKLI